MIRRRAPHLLLIAVAVAHGLSPLLLLGAHWWFGIDETVYLSQLNAHVPAGFFSAPRARGSTLLAAPVTLLSPSVGAVRIWLAALSAAGLYLGFRPWLRLRSAERSPWLVPLAAALLASLWPVIYYGFEVMPNEWVAFALLAACGWLLRFAEDHRRRHLVAIAFAIALVGLFRPSDALYAGAGMGVCVLFAYRPWRLRVLGWLALGVGFTAGVAEWVIEARLRYGGVRARIHAAQLENGGSGVHFAGAAQVRTLGGPLLCRGTCRAGAQPLYFAWWIGALVLICLGLGTAALAAGRAGPRSGLLAPHLVAVGVGVLSAAQYVFAVSYAAPRFLIPAYALFAIPAAAGLIAIGRTVRLPRPAGITPRTVLGIGVAAALAAGALAHLIVQVHVIDRHIRPQVAAFSTQMTTDARDLHADGVHAPCLVLGGLAYDQDLAYAAGCNTVPRSAPLIRAKIPSGTQVVFLRDTPPTRAVWPFWRELRLQPGPVTTARTAYLSVRNGEGSYSKSA